MKERLVVESVFRGYLTSAAKYAFNTVWNQSFSGFIPGVGEVKNAKAFPLSDGYILAYGDDFVVIMQEKKNES